MKKISKLMLLALSITLTLAAFSGCTAGEATNGEVIVYCYGDYFDPELMDSFQEETGIRVTVDYYDTAEEMYTVIDNNATSYDCICTSDYMIEKMIATDKLAELNMDNIPEIANIAPVYMEKSEFFDPGNKYSVPYMLGTEGIFYNKTMVDGKEINSWADLWNEEFADQIVMPDSVREAFMIALLKNNYSLNSDKEEEIKIASEDLIKQKGLVYKYSNDSSRDLIADGSAAIGVAWNGEYIYIKDLNPDVEFVIPKEGTEFFIDSWIIPKDAANKENAEKWINYLCKAEVAAQNFDYLGYTTPNEAAKALIDEEYISNEAIFPTDETISKCESLRMLDDKTTDLYSKYWKQVKAD